MIDGASSALTSDRNLKKNPIWDVQINLDFIGFCTCDVWKMSDCVRDDVLYGNILTQSPKQRRCEECVLTLGAAVP